MPDLRDVFEMVKHQTEPDLDSWAEQERRMRRSTRNRKAGVFALVAALTVVVAVLVVNLGDGDEGNGSVTNPTESVAQHSTTEGFVLVDINTGERTGTGVLPESSSVDVSPDGMRIVYTDSGDGVHTVVHIANVDGTDIQAFDATDGAQGPRWSPDGTMIVYQDKPGSSFKIGNLFILDVATGQTSQITDLESTAGIWWMGPTFSPDGESVLFTMESGRANTKRWDLWSVPVTGGEPTLVREDAMAGDYSPDGASIVYTEALVVDGEFAAGDLYTALPDGSDARVAVEGAGGFARWSPDGTMLVYDDDQGLSVLDVETGESRLILDGIGDFTDWVDDDTVIIEIGE